jgi:hypothetical protein
MDGGDDDDFVCMHFSTCLGHRTWNSRDCWVFVDGWMVSDIVRKKTNLTVSRTSLHEDKPEIDRCVPRMWDPSPRFRFNKRLCFCNGNKEIICM